MLATFQTSAPRSLQRATLRAALRPIARAFVSTLGDLVLLLLLCLGAAASALLGGCAELPRSLMDQPGPAARVEAACPSPAVIGQPSRSDEQAMRLALDAALTVYTQCRDAALKPARPGAAR